MAVRGVPLRQSTRTPRRALSSSRATQLPSSQWPGHENHQESLALDLDKLIETAT